MTVVIWIHCASVIQLLYCMFTLICLGSYFSILIRRQKYLALYRNTILMLYVYCGLIIETRTIVAVVSYRGSGVW